MRIINLTKLKVPEIVFINVKFSIKLDIKLD
jgi:hypothetical protein